MKREPRPQPATEELETMDAQEIITQAQRCLLNMADDRPFRSVDTIRAEAEAYLADMKTFVGYSEEEITATETRLGIRFPEVFQAFLRQMGKRHGDLFRGHDVARLDQFEKFRASAQALLPRTRAREFLPDKAVIFLLIDFSLEPCTKRLIRMLLQ